MGIVCILLAEKPAICKGKVPFSVAFALKAEVTSIGEKINTSFLQGDEMLFNSVAFKKVDIPECIIFNIDYQSRRK